MPWRLQEKTGIFQFLYDIKLVTKTNSEDTVINTDVNLKKINEGSKTFSFLSHQ